MVVPACRSSKEGRQTRRKVDRPDLTHVMDDQSLSVCDNARLHARCPENHACQVGCSSSGPTKNDLAGAAHGGQHPGGTGPVDRLTSRNVDRPLLDAGLNAVHGDPDRAHRTGSRCGEDDGALGQIGLRRVRLPGEGPGDTAIRGPPDEKLWIRILILLVHVVGDVAGSDRAELDIVGSGWGGSWTPACTAGSTFSATASPVFRTAGHHVGGVSGRMSL